MATKVKQVTLRLLPWLISGGIVAYLALTTDIPRFLDILGSINPWRFLLVTVLGMTVVFTLDSFCLKLLFRRFMGAVTYREMLSVKGTSYFLNIVNYNAGAGAVALFASKKKGFGFLESAGVMLFLNAMDIFALALLVAIGLTLGPDVLSATERSGLSWTCLALGLVLLGTIVFWVYKAPFLPRKVREFRIFYPFRESRVLDYPFFILLRTLFVVQYVFIHWGFLKVFGIHVPISHLLVYVPILTFIGVLPISIAGLGTTQVALRHFIAPYPPIAMAAPLVVGFLLISTTSAGVDMSSVAPALSDAMTQAGTDPVAHIDAYSTASIFAMLLGRIAIGLFTMRGTIKDFRSEDPG
jgi:uncharacterized membrane protein YbhN (UPF0104 family)